MERQKPAEPPSKRLKSNSASSAEPEGAKVPRSKSRFLPILPKVVLQSPELDVIAPTHRDVVSGERIADSRCPVPLCRRFNCDLRTHQVYARKVGLRQPQNDSDLSLQKRSRTLSRSRSVSPVLSIEGVEGLPALPLDGEIPFAYKSLFHHFFHQTYDRVTTLLAPPPLNPSAKRVAAATKHRVLAAGIVKPAFCLNFIASAYFLQTLRQRGIKSPPDHLTVTLYGQLVQLLRQQLDNFAKDEIESLILVIFTLVTFDVVREKLDSLDFHRRGMQMLVSSGGGLHNQPHLVPTVFSMDRLLALYTGAHPIYCTRQDRNLQRPHRFPERYGSYFSNKQTVKEMDPEVVAFAQDVCRVIELLEGHDIDFKVKDMAVTENADVHYFFFVRDRLAVEFIYLNVQYFLRHDKVKCILYATKIVDYFILMDNYICTIPVFLATRIQEAMLQPQTRHAHALSSEWKGQENVLCWILFVLIIAIPSRNKTITTTTHGHSWAIEILRRLLIAKHRTKQNKWRKGWRWTELENMRSFVWCDSRLDPLFLRACDRIERDEEDEHDDHIREKDKEDTQLTD